MPDLAWIDQTLTRLRDTYQRLADGLTSHSQGGVSASRERLEAIRAEIAQWEGERNRILAAQAGGTGAAGFAIIGIERA